ncbi:site-2 protease family protein [Arthrobacter sp. MSA 4-2]|uniref:site-2 protease family protein n=1 Tax=Arthrobacter sp. MSA 4-2 TaxID=2794349 RepID=UPI0018E75052|nr:site-2 protease family protein [Arthrobacter sp. MSA 4-2]MBJ2119712.1 site-2 protease family protein [Arthrobacter sp. MSA 4-2]
MSGPAAAPGAGPKERRLGVSLGRIAGIPVILTWPWFLVTVIIAVFFGPRVEANFPGIGIGAYVVALGYALLLALSVLIHEFAHALSARAFGWPTRRIVLNLWGGHTQFEHFSSSPGRSLAVALAGPASNFLLALVSWGIILVSGQGTVVDLLANTLFWANLILAVFNVLPGLPLDGGRIVESAVWKATGSQDRGTIAAGWTGRIIVLLFVGLVLGVPLLSGRAPQFTLVIISVLVATFMWAGAGEAIRTAHIRLRIPGLTAGMLKQPAVGLPSASTVSELRRLAAGRPDLAAVLLDAEGRPEFVVDFGALADVPEEAAGTTRASTSVRPLASTAGIDETASGTELLKLLDSSDGFEFPVTNAQGTVTGVLHRLAVIDALTGKRTPGSA